jgi:hypothetical protein
VRAGDLDKAAQRFSPRRASERRPSSKRRLNLGPIGRRQRDERDVSTTAQGISAEALPRQAHYYIGKSAFEAKDYESAIPELKTARELNAEQYGAPAGLRIMSSYFYLKQRDPLARKSTSLFDRFA